MWHPIIKKSQLSVGVPKRVMCNGKPIGLFLRPDGTPYAFSDVCTHEEGTLSDGVVMDDKVIECPLHGARFNMATGKVLALPAMEDIQVYKTKIEGDDILIDMEEKNDFMAGIDDIGLPDEGEEDIPGLLHVCACGGNCGCH